jgi:hypothetical protein
MSEEAKESAQATAEPKTGKAEKTPKPPSKKKSWAQNCVETNARIRRKNWYYKNGKYFASKAASDDHFKKLAEEKLKAEQEAAAAKQAAAKAAEEAVKQSSEKAGEETQA